MPVMRDPARPLGVVYTPREVAAAMVELVLAPLIAGRSADELLELHICDPAIGEGIFLIEAVRVLADALVAAWGDTSSAAVRADEVRANEVRADEVRAHEVRAHEARRLVAARCIVGVDIDARAVAAARAALGVGEEVLRVEDAMVLDWAAAFPEVFARGGFDVVVGNPPYIRQERLAAKPSLRGYASYHGGADLYVYFIELAHRVLRPRGRYCLIVPNKWLTVAYGRALRTYLAEQRSIEGVVDLARVRVFGDADAFPCILWGTVGAPAPPDIVGARPDADVPVAHALRAASASSAAAMPVIETTATSTGERAIGASLHARAAWGAGPWHIEGASERALLERIEKRWPRLSEIVPSRAARGVVTGCNRAFVLDAATRTRMVEEDPTVAAIVRPFVKGRDVRPWRVVDRERWLLMIDRGTSFEELPAVVRAHLAQFREALEPRPPSWEGAWRGRKPGAYAWHELQDPLGPLVKARGPRLLFQDIQTAPACALDEAGELAPDTTVWMLPTDDRVILAILNSPLYGWYARRRFPPALNGAVRPKLEYLRTLPIAQPSPAQRRELEALVTQRLEANNTALDATIARAIDELYELSAAERREIARGT